MRRRPFVEPEPTRVRGDALDAGVDDTRREQLAPAGDDDTLVESTREEPPAEQRLGRYRLLRRLGAGGMAEVFLATQLGPAGFEKECVVKRVRKDLLKKQRYVDMFLREARVAARLNHSNVVQIFELGEEQGEYFLAMEYLDGVTLYRAARLSWAHGESLPMEVVLAAVADAAAGLHHAHNARDASGTPTLLVHRDISPDNLMLTREGIAKVLDFGIARPMDAEHLTQVGEVKGKVPYMSPEQIEGAALDGRSDLWSLGVTLYWLLTARRPFDGLDYLATARRIRFAAPQRPSELNPHIPRRLDDIVLALLEKEPAHRPANGAEVRDALHALVGHGMRVSLARRLVERVLALPAGKQLPRTGVVGGAPAARPVTAELVGGPPRAAAELHEAPTLQMSSADETLPTGNALASVLERTEAGATTAEGIGEPHSAQTSRVEPKSPARRLTAVGGVVSLGALLLGAAVIVGVGAAPRLAGDREAEAEAPSTAAGGDAAADLAAPAAGAHGDDDERPAERSPSAEPGTTAESAAAVPSARPARRRQGASLHRKRTTERDAAPAAPAKTVEVEGRAPAGILWQDPEGRVLGRGDARLQVPPELSAVQAVDPMTGGVSSVPIEGGVADHHRLGQGQLALRVRPWAEVFLGTRALGPTPVPPVLLVEGRYQVTLRYEGVERTETFTIRPSRQTHVRVDMRE